MRSAKSLSLVRMQQPRRVLIESSDRRHPLAHVGDQVVYGGTAFRVFIGRDVAFRFIEEDIRLPLFDNRLAVEFDAVRIRIHPVIGCLDHLAVDLYASRSDPLSRIRAGTYACPGKNTIESFLQNTTFRACKWSIRLAASGRNLSTSGACILRRKTCRLPAQQLSLRGGMRLPPCRPRPCR